jgi:hypothetical protein
MLLISRDWRQNIILLAIQYIGVFLLVAQSWPIEMAIVKMVAGWMTGAILGIAMISTPQAWQDEEQSWPSGRIFRLLASGLVLLTVFSIAPQVQSWVPGVSLEMAWGGLILMGMGILNLGLTEQPLRISIGLLTFLSGFEIFYAAVETSTLVAGLLAAVELGIALAGAYLLIALTMEEE